MLFLISMKYLQSMFGDMQPKLFKFIFDIGDVTIRDYVVSSMEEDHIYILTNFIDAHEKAQHKILHFMGNDNDGTSLFVFYASFLSLM